jgi:hypothetical protein
MFHNQVTREQVLRLRLQFEHGNIETCQNLEQDDSITSDVVAQLLVEYVVF